MKKRLEGDRTRSTLFLALFQLRPLQSEEVPHLVEHRELHLSLKPFFSATGALNRPLKQRYPVSRAPSSPTQKAKPLPLASASLRVVCYP